MSFSAVERVVRERIGLDAASLGAAVLPRAAAARMRVRGVSSADGYAGLLAADSAEWAALLADLIVSETWFFRGGRAYFAHLSRWIRGRRGPSPVRVLCVPCSTGEEPYSLAVALDEDGVSPASYRIDGVELSADLVARAAAGNYAAFSFREPGPDPRPRYFRETVGGRWAVLAGVREAVRFRPGNLAVPEFLAGEPPYNLILCRNLFIYLTAAARIQALANFDRLLAPDGLLGLTAAEADALPAGRYTADGPPSFALFRRTTAPHDATPTADRVEPSAAAHARDCGVGNRASIIGPFPPDDPEPVAAASPSMADVRYLADAGRLAEARAAGERAVAASPSADLLGLLGVIELAAGRSDAAAEAFRKALYLDPDHAEALEHMVVLAERRGEPAQAAGFRRRLARLERGAPA